MPETTSVNPSELARRFSKFNWSGSLQVHRCRGFSFAARVPACAKDCIAAVAERGTSRFSVQNPGAGVIAMSSEDLARNELVASAFA
jgi:hypothetical protein